MDIYCLVHVRNVGCMMLCVGGVVPEGDSVKSHSLSRPAVMFAQRSMQHPSKAR